MARRLAELFCKAEPISSAAACVLLRGRGYDGRKYSGSIAFIRLARLFYIYGKWDAFLKIGFMEASDDYCDVFWELIEASADFTAIDYSRDMCKMKWYFSFEDMVEYYRLCRVYSD